MQNSTDVPTESTFNTYEETEKLAIVWHVAEYCELGGVIFAGF